MRRYRKHLVGLVGWNRLIRVESRLDDSSKAWSANDWGSLEDAQDSFTVIADISFEPSLSGL